MTIDITVELADRMIEDDGALPERLREQEKFLLTQRCDNNRISDLLEIYPHHVLLDIIGSEKHCRVDFPELEFDNRGERTAFIEEIRKHSEVCPRCRLKNDYDLEWDTIVENSISKYRNSIRQIYGTNTEKTEADHKYAELALI